MTSHIFYVVAQIEGFPPEVIHECDSVSDAEVLCQTMQENAPEGMFVYVSRHYPGDLIELN